MSCEDDFIYELPFLPGARFWIAQGYGGAYSHTGNSHYSIDITMPENTPICAARSGVVYSVIDHFTEGGTDLSFRPKANIVGVLHVDDTVASYVHLVARGALVCPGQFVTVGQRIGSSGNTGWSSHPHLHFHVADAASHERVPTRFNTAEQGPTILEADNWYSRPVSSNRRNIVIDSADSRPAYATASRDRDPSAFSFDLIDCAHDLMGRLSDAGYDVLGDYSYVDTLQDVHGLQVCEIRDPADALQITRLLLQWFPGWNAGWHRQSAGDWAVHIQRDRDQAACYWDTD